jgi:hypothetical protein
MERETIINIGPICRFGPGGEYVTVWPAGSEIIETVVSANQAPCQKNTLARVLNVLAGMTDALRGSKAVTRDSGIATRVSSDEQMVLFDDDLRTNQDVKYKAQHHIRTTAKKRVCITLAETGTLFDSNNDIAKSA